MADLPSNGDVVQDEVTKQRARPPYGLSSHSVGVSRTGALTSFDRELIVDVRGLCSARFHTPGLFGVDCLTIVTAARFSNDSHCRFGQVDVGSKPRSRRVRGPELSRFANIRAHGSVAGATRASRVVALPQ